MSLVKPDSYYRAVYESKNFVSGVDNIYVTLRRPDNIKIGPLELVEEIIPELAGNYSVNIYIPANAPLGEYVGNIFSMDEGIKSSFRFSVQDLASDGTGSSICDDDVEISIDSSIANIYISESKEVDLVAESLAVNILLSESEAVLLINENEVELNLEVIEVELIAECEV